MLVGYARVSTRDQTLNSQLDALVRMGVDERNIYQEKITGTRRDRPELDRMIGELKPSDTVIIAELTRLGRSAKDLFTIVEQIKGKGANIKSLREAWLDTTTPQSELMFTVFCGLSQFERDLTSQRTKEGLQAARARGRVGGRPAKGKMKAETIKFLYLTKKYKIVEIMKELDLSRSTVNRVVREIKSEVAASL
jgi:DNA invertase Pin-like site-specific DNA recombinase